MKNSEKAKHLVQGSIWVNKKGRKYTVLAVSNISVHENEKASERQLEMFPLCVIFLNSENDVFSLDVDKFINAYDYDSDNENVDECMNNVFDANVGKYKSDIEEVSVDDIEIDASNDEDTESDIHKFKDNAEEVAVDTKEPVTEESIQESEEVKKVLPFEFEANGEPVISKNELKSALCGYSEYVDGTGNHFHKFLFTPSENVTIQNLKVSFDPSVNSYTSAVINYKEPISVEWNTLCNVTVEYHNSDVQIVVIVANENEFVAVDANEANTVTPVASELPTEAPIEVVEESLIDNGDKQMPESEATITDSQAEKIVKDILGE